MAGKLADKAVFRHELESLQASLPPAVDNWCQRLQKFFSSTRAASAAKLHDRQFLTELFESDHVSATGMCTVRTAPAIANDEFVSWFAENASRPLPDDPLEAETQLIKLHDETSEKFRELCGRRPLLKINRALCALYPDYFTTVADEGKLKFLYRELGGNVRDHVVHIHIVIRHMVDEALGTVAQDSKESVQRICLPWLLYQRVSDDKTDETPQLTSGLSSTLVPAPAALRRKGLTATKGYFQTLLGYLPAFGSDGLTYDEFCDVIRQANPTLVESSIRTIINVIMRDFDVCRRNGNVYELSARGINLLESQDPQELADQLLTKVLGVDYTIRTLSSGPKSKAELVAILQTVNPGWTTAFAPTALLGWLLSLGVISYSAASGYALTDAGRRWNDLITWDPPKLPKVAETVIELQAETDAKLVLPEWETLKQRLANAAAGKFEWDQGLVEQLHAGLWFHPVRHFAVMAGLSGSGKTQLALNYANALCGEQLSGQESVKVIPIQPGYFDTSPLLGYVHPIQRGTYVGTPFLDLVLRAAENPTTAFVAILDEMNLSHPEQYLAPILSAMETHSLVELHQIDDEIGGVPKQIKYPANLALIGTVNMDETTHGLSDKVLDRAFTLEFWNIDVESFPKWELLKVENVRTKVKSVLRALMNALAPVRLHFGWRSIDDVVSYLAFSEKLGTNPDTALDDVLYAKVLPKLRGENSDRFVTAVAQVMDICQQYELRRCKVKVLEMIADLNETGSARFWR
ncbi:McrB family protein [Paraburkholderia dilworthii]|uniref:Restriction endonuclease n=1 Tax=Paraburkholderia dilworthii TaxID=948106 RepID=A0ABW9DHW3_9BURK